MVAPRPQTSVSWGQLDCARLSSGYCCSLVPPETLTTTRKRPTSRGPKLWAHRSYSRGCLRCCPACLTERVSGWLPRRKCFVFVADPPLGCCDPSALELLHLCYLLIVACFRLALVDAVVGFVAGFVVDAAAVVGAELHCLLLLLLLLCSGHLLRPC